MCQTWSVPEPTGLNKLAQKSFPTGQSLAVIQGCWQRRTEYRSFLMWIFPSPHTHKHTSSEWKGKATHTDILVHIQVKAGFMCYWIFYCIFCFKIELTLYMCEQVQQQSLCPVWPSVFSRCGQLQGARLHPTSTLPFGKTSVCVCEGERERVISYTQTQYINLTLCHTVTQWLSLSVVSVCSALCSAPSWVQPLCRQTVEGVFTPFTQHTDLRVHTYDAAKATFHQTFHRWKWQKLSSKVTPFSFWGGVMFVCAYFY